MFDSKTHRAIGLTTLSLETRNTAQKGFKRPTWAFRTGVIPTAPILQWIDAKLAQGKIAPDLQGRVQQLLDDAR